jgi:hypothetical protein
MNLIAFCEAPDDFRIASDLVDRVLRDVGAAWVADVMDASPEGVRTYFRDEDRAFFDLHKLKKYVGKLGAAVPHGHFDGKRGAADAVMGRTVFTIVRHLSKSRSVDAVIVMRDLDDEPARRDGMQQARREASSWATFGIVVGCPNIMREAWVLVGFEAADPIEEALLVDMRKELGFSPVSEAHQLDSNDEQAKRSPKRVLRVLTRGDRTREEPCWQATDLDTLRTRCPSAGLGHFLKEVEEVIVERVGRR